MVKRRLIREKIIPYICASCGNSGEWDSKILSLHLEHKNGISNDNRLENLCFLCPNCHAQTETYAGKNLRGSNYGKPNKTNKCKDCSALITNKAHRCIACARKHTNTFYKGTDKPKPSKEKLYEQLKHNSFLYVGRFYDVSDNAIRRWCRSYEIPHKSSYYRVTYPNSNYSK